MQLLRFLETEGTADLLPDDDRRLHPPEPVRGGGRRASRNRKAAGHSLLNGFPAVNHGLAGCRRVTEAVDQADPGPPRNARRRGCWPRSPWPAGFTSYEGGGISYNIPYAKKVQLGRVDPDLAVRRPAGRPLRGERRLHQPRALRPPDRDAASRRSSAIPSPSSEGLLALEQGVKSITLGYGQGGNVLQDLAAHGLAPRAGRRVLRTRPASRTTT
ncbi:MAG: hypothetical protein MZW92_01595 [Comamonadaceae bacterium]|nr:hypothetical protein [Comamonadaceae bacterium]